MYMHVENGLPCFSARIYAHVEPRDRIVFSRDLTSLLSEQRVYGVQFGLIEIELISHMAFGNDKRVQGCNGKSVSDRHAQLIFSYDALCG